MNNISVRDINKYTAAYEPANARDPTELEKKVNTVFMKFVEQEIKLESDEEMHRRDGVLAEVRNIFTDWVKFVATKVLHIPEDEADDAGGELFISGSHRLGVRDIGADIDTVCVAPNFCTREHFFTHLKQEFLSRAEVTDLNAVEEAFVPLMSFEYRGVSIDLLFARLAENRVPKSLDILDDNILIGLDDQTEKSLNGPRVTNMIFKLVGEKTFSNFLIVLRCIRKWAKRRGIYGNKLGYLGGVNCNILVAFICQLYPNFTPSSLLFRFFKQYRDWKWPEPIMLNNIQQNPPGALLSSARDVWQPNQHDFMPIITPAYPAMNSAHNVSEHTFLVMQEEFVRGYELYENILKNKHWQGVEHWEKLFEPSDFFIKYPHYLACHIIGTGDNTESRSWIGFVESRIRRLTLLPYLQTLPILAPIHLYPIVSKTKKSDNSICYFIGFSFDIERIQLSGEKNIRIDEVIGQFQDNLLDPERGYKGDRVEGLDFYVEHLTWRKLPKEVFDMYGGYDTAKKLRHEMGYEKKKQMKPTGGEETTNGGEKTEGGGETGGVSGEQKTGEDGVTTTTTTGTTAANPLLTKHNESYITTILNRLAAANAASAAASAANELRKRKQLVLPKNLPFVNTLPMTALEQADAFLYSPDIRRNISLYASAAQQAAFHASIVQQAKKNAEALQERRREQRQAQQQAEEERKRTNGGFVESKREGMEDEGVNEEGVEEEVEDEEEEVGGISNILEYRKTVLSEIEKSLMDGFHTQGEVQQAVPSNDIAEMKKPPPQQEQQEQQEQQQEEEENATAMMDGVEEDGTVERARKRLRFESFDDTNTNKKVDREDDPSAAAVAVAVVATVAEDDTSSGNSTAMKGVVEEEEKTEDTAVTETVPAAAVAETVTTKSTTTTKTYKTSQIIHNKVHHLSATSMAAFVIPNVTWQLLDK